MKKKENICGSYMIERINIILFFCAGEKQNITAKTTPEKNRKYIMSDFGANNVFSKGGLGTVGSHNRSVNRYD